MASTTTSPGVGDLLRDWRRRRRLSQLDVALDAAVSARHLSFVETGRSQPSRELIMHLAEHFDVPLRERNNLLLAAGYAPVYAETPLSDDTMAPMRAAMAKVLAGHEPYPAVIVDRTWNLVEANAPALRLMSQGVDPALLEPPVNTLRLSLHPDGLAPRIANLAEYGAHLLTRLRRQLALAPDGEVGELLAELESYPGVGAEHASTALDPTDAVFSPLELRTPDGELLTFFSTLTTFGTALDITAAELSIEQLFPADERTAEALRTPTNGA